MTHFMLTFEPIQGEPIVVKAFFLSLTFIIDAEHSGFLTSSIGPNSWAPLEGGQIEQLPPPGGASFCQKIRVIIKYCCS